MNLYLPFRFKENFNLPKPKYERLYNNKDEAILTEDFSIDIKHKGSDLRITAKKGFVFDGFSVPWILQWYQSSYSGAIAAALIHDLLYCTHLFSVGASDWIFLEILDMYGECWFHRNALYLAVRACGWAVYPKTEKEITYWRQFIEVELLCDQDN